MVLWTLCGLLLAVLLLTVDFSRAQAASIMVKEGNTDGVLQEGNLLLEDQSDAAGRSFGVGDNSEAAIRSFGLGGGSVSSQGAGATNREKAKKAVENAVKNFKAELNVSAYNLSVSEMSALYADLVNGHPEFFYLRSYAYVYNAAGQVLQINFFYTSSDLAYLKKMSSAYENKVKEILASINPTWSDLEKALYVNDYLAIHCQYDNSLQRFTA